MADPSSTLGILTQNMDSQSTLPANEFTPSMPHNILVICRQEVKDPDHAPLVPDTYLTTNGLFLISEVALNSSRTKSKQNVKMAVYSKDRTYIVEKGTIPVSIMAGVLGTITNIGQAYAGYSKGAVWTKLTKNGVSFLFVNAHLPMSAKSPGRGIDYRIKAFKTILTKLSPHVTENTYLFVTGDLNFRIITGKHQLNDLLAADTLPIPLTDISPPSGQKYTCKFKPIEATDCRKQIIRPGEAPIDPSCFDPKREPSRCDRILIGDKNLEMMKYETITIGSQFDHNGIYAVFRLPHTTSRLLSSYNYYGPTRRKNRRRLERRRTRKQRGGGCPAGLSPLQCKIWLKQEAKKAERLAKEAAEDAAFNKNKPMSEEEIARRKAGMIKDKDFFNNLRKNNNENYITNENAEVHEFNPDTNVGKD